jgi:hypothetical protein
MTLFYDRPDPEPDDVEADAGQDEDDEHEDDRAVLAQALQPVGHFHRQDAEQDGESRQAGGWA